MTFSESLHRYRIELLLTVILISVLYGTVVSGMVMDWYRDENYSHGFLVPLIAGYFIYDRWGELKSAPVVPAMAGVLVIILGLLQLIIGTVGLEYFTIRSSLIVLLVGVVLFFWGMEIFKAVRLPILYLLFMVPLPYIVYNALAFPLKQFVSYISVGFMKLVGVTEIGRAHV